MPLFLDVHDLDSGVSMDEAAQAHRADLAHQSAHGVTYQRYSVDESHGRTFCLVDAPDAEAPARCTRRRTAWSPTRSSRYRND
jgi:hypothetical protein